MPLPVFFFASPVHTPHNKTTRLNELFTPPTMSFALSSFKCLSHHPFGPKLFTLPPSSSIFVPLRLPIFSLHILYSYVLHHHTTASVSLAAYVIQMPPLHPLTNSLHVPQNVSSLGIPLDTKVSKKKCLCAIGPKLLFFITARSKRKNKKPYTKPRLGLVFH